MRQLFLFITMIFLIPINSWAVPVTVSFEPSTSSVYLNDIFTVDIIADIPDPVVGWGLDIGFNSSVISLHSAPVIGPDWFSAFSADGDGLAGLALPAVSGSGVLLATLEFEAILDFAVTNLTASITPGDNTEGFALGFPAPPGSFAEVNFLDATIFVEPRPIHAPEPTSLALVIIGIAGLLYKCRAAICAK